MNMHKN